MNLRPIDSVRPSTYNPREADPARLDLVELSLRKLGWLLPIFATPDGEIVSGHQRWTVAVEMGLEEVPVKVLPPMDLEKRKAINIAFNRGTNDLTESDTTETLTRELAAAEVEALAAALPDKDDLFPCLSAQPMPVAELVEVNNGRWNRYARNVAKTLSLAGAVMPLVATSDLRVVNGIGRLELAAENGQETVDVVVISDDEAAFARAMLNFLSMDFAVHTRYADLLRYNSFRRAHGKRKWLGRTFVFPIVGTKPSSSFDITDPARAAEWKRRFGTTVLDFGAGTLSETYLLRSAGVDCVPFEPFRLTGGEIDRTLSVQTIREEFLPRVPDTKFDSIFLAAILNSVPFYEDRRHILVLLAALSDPTTVTYSLAPSTKQSGYRNTTGSGIGLNQTWASAIKFRLDYEPATTLADFSANPKVQKYHTPKEWYDLWKTQWRRVQVTEGNNNVRAIAADPIRPTWEQVEAAVRFEFDLPYPGGERMGLVDEALDAFRRRYAR